MLEMAQYPRIPVQFVVVFLFFRRCKSSHRFASVVIPVGFCPPPNPFPVTRAIGGLRKSQDLGEQEVRRYVGTVQSFSSDVRCEANLRAGVKY